MKQEYETTAFGNMEYKTYLNLINEGTQKIHNKNKDREFKQAIELESFPFNSKENFLIILS